MSERIRVAINGFGRIGRTLTRLLIASPQIDLIAINDLSDALTLGHLFKYDSINGKFHGDVSADSESIQINGHKIHFFQTRDWTTLPWMELAVDVVIDCSGQIKTASQATDHLAAGAQRVLISAPVEDEQIPLFVHGVSPLKSIAGERIISNASCTTNNAAPMIQLLDQFCGIESCYITTVHSYTSDQRLHDAPHKDLRRSRAANESIIPTTTGAAKALTRVFPNLADKMGGCGIRVPVPNGSLTDITCLVRNPLAVNEINHLFKEAAQGHLAGILEYTEDAIVGVDVLKNPHSCLFDAQLTSVIGSMVKVVGWYDNEFGYSNRMLDVLKIWPK
jgi:glyceraldehyde 3-phosphate dehydrogenase